MGHCLCSFPPYFKLEMRSVIEAHGDHRHQAFCQTPELRVFPWVGRSPGLALFSLPMHLYGVSTALFPCPSLWIGLSHVFLAGTLTNKAYEAWVDKGEDLSIHTFFDQRQKDHWLEVRGRESLSLIKKRHFYVLKLSVPRLGYLERK